MNAAKEVSATGNTKKAIAAKGADLAVLLAHDRLRGIELQTVLKQIVEQRSYRAKANGWPFSR